MTKAFEACPHMGDPAPTDHIFSREFLEWIRMNTILSPKSNIQKSLGSSLLAAETTFYQWILPANFLNTDGEIFRTRIKGTTAANANNKQLLLKLGAVTIYDSTALAANAKTFDVTVEYLRKTVSTASAFVSGWINNAAITPTNTVNLTPDFTTSLTLKWSGVAATADADMLTYLGMLEKYQQMTDALR